MDRYNPKPWHLVLPIFMMLVGEAFGVMLDMGWFGLGAFLAGVGSASWIIVAGIWQAHTEYWDSLTRFADTMNRSKTPELWKALGLSPPTRKFPVVDAPKELPNPMQETPELQMRSTENFDLSGSMAQFRTFCDGVLTGAPITESYWVGGEIYGQRTFKRLRKELRDREYIVQINPKTPTLGYTRTRRGTKFMLRHCSPSVKAMVESQTTEFIEPRENLKLLEEPPIEKEE